MALRLSRAQWLDLIICSKLKMTGKDNDSNMFDDPETVEQGEQLLESILE